MPLPLSGFFCLSHRDAGHSFIKSASPALKSCLCAAGALSEFISKAGFQHNQTTFKSAQVAGTLFGRLELTGRRLQTFP